MKYGHMYRCNRKWLYSISYDGRGGRKLDTDETLLCVGARDSMYSTGVTYMLHTADGGRAWVHETSTHMWDEVK